MQPSYFLINNKAKEPRRIEIDDVFNIMESGNIKVDEAANREPIPMPNIEDNHNNDEAILTSFDFTLSVKSAAVEGILAPHAAP